MDKFKFDPNAPAFGEGAQKFEVKADSEPDGKPAAEVVTPEKPADPEQQPELDSDDKPVPYSRFKKYHTLAKEATAEAEEWRQRYEDALQARQEKHEAPAATTPGDVPSWWTKLYGDSDASKEGWNLMSQANQEVFTQAKREAVEALQEQRVAEERQLGQNLETIDSQMDSLGDELGRDLTDTEQSAILDIVDEYTPKDDDGNYLGAIMPFDKAWEIYELKEQAAKAPQRQARDRVSAISGNRSQGEPTVDAESDKNFNPLDWQAWKKRL